MDRAEYIERVKPLLFIALLQSVIIYTFFRRSVIERLLDEHWIEI